MHCSRRRRAGARRSRGGAGGSPAPCKLRAGGHMAPPTCSWNTSMLSPAGGGRGERRGAWRGGPHAAGEEPVAARPPHARAHSRQTAAMQPAPGPQACLAPDRPSPRRPRTVLHSQVLGAAGGVDAGAVKHKAAQGRDRGGGGERGAAPGAARRWFTGPRTAGAARSRCRAGLCPASDPLKPPPRPHRTEVCSIAFFWQ
jgi:hypothetical protein